MSKIAIYTSNVITEEEVRNRFKKIISPQDIVVLLTPSGSEFLTINPDSKNPHILSRLDSSFRLAIFTRECPSLFNTDYSYQWIASLSLDMGVSSSVLIEIKDSRFNKDNMKLTPESLKSVFPDTRVSGNLHEVSFRASQMPARSLRTAQKFFHALFPQFCTALREIQNFKKGSPEEVIIAEATRCFKYGLYGGIQKSFLAKTVAQNEGLAANQLRILDVGGGYGFFAIEMAAAGHKVKVIDVFEGYLNVAKHLVSISEFADCVEFELCDMAKLENPEGLFDVVTFFGSLLYVPRDFTQTVIGNSMKSLKKGGVFLLHENTKAIIDPKERDYAACFEPEELKNYLTIGSSSPKFYNILNGKEIDWEAAKSRVVAASIKKAA